MKVKVRIQFGRSSGGDETKPFHLEIRDEASGVEFLDLRMSVEDFADLLTNRMSQAEGEFRAGNLVGTIAQHKTELVPFDPYQHFDERRSSKLDDAYSKTKSVVKALRPFEVDGWIASISDMWNGHNRKILKGQNDVFQEVHFHRYVHPESGIPIST